MSIYYKVVKAVDGIITSAVRTNSHGLQYKENEYVYPQKTGTFIFVFNTLENARKFSSGLLNAKIYECNCIGIATSDEIDWKNQYDISELPLGTMFAYGVKLIKCIEDETIYRRGTKFLVDGREAVLAQITRTEYNLFDMPEFNRWFEPSITVPSTQRGVRLSDLQKALPSYHVSLAPTLY